MQTSFAAARQAAAAPRSQAVPTPSADIFAVSSATSVSPLSRRRTQRIEIRIDQQVTLRFRDAVVDG